MRSQRTHAQHRKREAPGSRRRHARCLAAPARRARAGSRLVRAPGRLLHDPRAPLRRRRRDDLRDPARALDPARCEGRLARVVGESERRPRHQSAVPSATLHVILWPLACRWSSSCPCASDSWPAAPWAVSSRAASPSGSASAYAWRSRPATRRPRDRAGTRPLRPRHLDLGRVGNAIHARRGRIGAPYTLPLPKGAYMGGATSVTRRTDRRSAGP